MNMFTIDDFRGLVTAVLLGLFVWLIAWSWSKARRQAFDAAARMPLEEDEGAK
jgi:cytochrome c oxidase cbb3-type subunit 4